MQTRRRHTSIRRLLVAGGATLSIALPVHAPVLAQDRLVSTCSGVSLPPSAVTDIVAPVLTGVVGPLESTVNGLLSILLPPLSLDLTGLLSAAADGDPITLSVLAADGAIIGPADQCVTTSDSIALDAPAGIAVGGNRITGLGAAGIAPSRAYDIDAVAIGNGALADDGAIASIAIGANSTASAANSIALGAGSVAARGELGSYTALGLAGPQVSAGEVSVGAAGGLRQITNVAAGRDATDAATVGQLAGINDALTALGAAAVHYAGPDRDLVTLAGAGGTRLTNLAAGAIAAGSTDAVTGGQIHGLGTQVAGLIGAGSTYDAAAGTFSASLQFAGRNYGNVQAVVNAIDMSLASIGAGGSGAVNPYFNANSVGADSQALAIDSTAIGPQAIAAAEGSLAAGRGAEAWSDGSVAIGDGSVAASGKAVVIGSLNRAAGDGAVAIGDPNIATGDGAVAMGRDNQATGIGTVGVGDTNIVAGDGAVGLGQGNIADGRGAVALGSSNLVTGANSIAIGDTHDVQGIRSLAIGYNNVIAADDGLAIGSWVVATGSGAQAIGSQAQALGANAVTLGNRALASGQDATALGTAAEAAQFGTAVGERASADDGGTALGAQALASAVGSTALGVGAEARASGSVALGASALAVRGVQAAYAAFGLGGPQRSAGEIAIGRTIPLAGSPDAFPTGERQLTGLAAGSAETDAVNVAQLRGTAGNLGTAMAAAIGGGASYDGATGTVSGPSFTVGGVTYSDVGAALSGLAAQIGSGPALPAPGAVTYDSAAFDRVTLAGPAGTTLANVAPGTVAAGSTEAVNGSQLAATDAQVAANSAAIAALNSGGGAPGPVRYADAASPTVPSGGIASNDATLVGADAAAPVRLHNVAAGTIAAGSTDAVNGDQVAAIAAVAGNGVQYDRTATGGRSDRVTLAGGTAGGAVTLANVADGALDATSTQAVNGRQLAATDATAQTALATAQGAAALGRNAVQYDAAAQAVTFTHPGDFPTAAPVTLRNVAAGVAPTDAVNVGQLAQAMNSSVATSTAYTDMRLQALDFRLEDMRRDAEGGTAAAMAMGQIPAIEGEVTLGGGVGVWQGESAMAIGFAHQTEGRRINLAATYTTRGQAGAAVGIGFALR